jgi:hypothetical protein
MGRALTAASSAARRLLPGARSDTSKPVENRHNREGMATMSSFTKLGGIS